MIKIFLVALMLFTVNAQADVGTVASFQPGISGSFFNRDSSGQGINLEYLERFNSDGTDKLVMYLYSYSEVDGSPTWLICIGDIEKKFSDVNKNAALLNCHYPVSGNFLEDGISNTFKWGTATVAAMGCHSLKIKFYSNSGVPTVSPMPPSREVGILANHYEYNVTRLTPMQRTCVQQCPSPDFGPSRCRIDNVN